MQTLPKKCVGILEKGEIHIQLFQENLMGLMFMTRSGLKLNFKILNRTVGFDA